MYNEPVPENKAKFKNQPLELLVLVAFLIAWITSKDAIFATKVLTLGTAIQMALMYLLKMPISNMQKGLFVAVFIGGGLTIAFQNPDFIQWKVTVVNTGFAIALLVMEQLGKSPIKALIEASMAKQDAKVLMPLKAWRQVTLLYVGFFLGVALVNAYITLYMDFGAWVWFRSILFVVSLVVLPAIIVTYLVLNKAVEPVKEEPNKRDIE